ncbi:MAG: DEAD/DEAH box helicase [Christensenellaceae bacterium]
MNAFDRLAPYIKDYIFYHKWTELREVQVAACEIIFDCDDNLLLSSGTASGKTEAAFLPALTTLYENPSSSIGILYISPLKALINDQFSRLEDLLHEANVPVHKWHGDVAVNKKQKLLKNPQGVLQITPESLESMLINRREVCLNLFCDLRFIIIDEVHYFMGNVRGIQLLSIMERLKRLSGSNPRRIGLSATLGDYALAEAWLNSGTDRNCATPKVSAGKRAIRLAIQSFEMKHDDKTNGIDSGILEQEKFLYQNTLNKKAIIFTNARADAEFTIAQLKKLATDNHTRDVYRIHHGSLSASVREETERAMKETQGSIVTAATVTLELGIDIGALDRILQVGSPFSVSSLVQRLGRCGRRGNPSEMYFTFLKDNPENKDAVSSINWDFLKCIAIIQLYLEEKWIEPITAPMLPYSILYHQTMSYVTSNGEIAPANLAQNILTLTPFQNVSQSDFKLLLQHLLEIKHLQKTERNGLIIGSVGEAIVNHYEFYTVFESPKEFTVRHEAKAVGTIPLPFPVGQAFALAGQCWEVTEINMQSKTIYVKKVYTSKTVGWLTPGGFDIHTRIMQKMIEILSCQGEYSYLSKSCKMWLFELSQLARQAGFTEKSIISMGSNQFLIFAMLGTAQTKTLCLALNLHGVKSAVREDMNCFILSTFDGTEQELSAILRNIKLDHVDKEQFILGEIDIVAGKYNEFVPKELLQKQFLTDYVDIDGMQANMRL